MSGFWCMLLCMLPGSLSYYMCFCSSTTLLLAVCSLPEYGSSSWSLLVSILSWCLSTMICFGRLICPVPGSFLSAAYSCVLDHVVCSINCIILPCINFNAARIELLNSLSCWCTSASSLAYIWLSCICLLGRCIAFVWGWSTVFFFFFLLVDLLEVLMEISLFSFFSFFF